jgi:hypothetical protein
MAGEAGRPPGSRASGESGEQVSGSVFPQKLNARGDTVPRVRYTVIATGADEVVTPYQSELLTGSDVHNVLLQDLCRVDVFEHVLIGAAGLIAFHEVAFDPAHATPVPAPTPPTCRNGPPRAARHLRAARPPGRPTRRAVRCARVERDRPSPARPRG